MTRASRLAAIAISGLLVLAACGGDDDGDGDGGGGSDALVVGTTDTVTALDPAGSYDLGSSTLQYNIYQNLMSVKPGETEPTPDLAESCEFTDPQTYECTLKDNQNFSNGDPVTSADVKHSFERQLTINDPKGAAVLLGSMDSVEAPDEKTVIFHLNKPDTTWPYVLTHTVANIVSSEVFPADKLLPDDQVVGSGVYKVDQYTAKEQAVFSANEHYGGYAEPKSDNVLMQYYNDSPSLRSAVEQGQVDVAYRSLASGDVEGLREASDRGVSIVEGEGAEIRYFVFNVGTEPFNNKAVRQAVAQIIDRDAIATNAYRDTVTPLYSPVAAGFPGQVETFKDKYGEPNADAATDLLAQAGVETPISFQLWYSPTHYGPHAVDEANEVKRQLEATGLFQVDVQSTEWEQYQDAYERGDYPMFHLGWFPDFPDTDNYLSPFFVDGGFFSNNYSNPQLNQMVDQELSLTEVEERTPIFEQIQQVVAEDVPTLPSWQGKQIAAVRDGVSGVEDTFDISFQFRFWVVSKEG